jgi:regulator of sigma E protease
LSGQIPANQIGGPILIAQASHQFAAMGAASGNTWQAKAALGLIALLPLCAFISVHIGFLNLLPIPALDGGHLAFYAYEAAAKRPLDAAVQAVSYRVGLALLLGLMLFATTNDLQRSRVFQFVRGLFP